MFRTSSHVPWSQFSFHPTTKRFIMCNASAIVSLIRFCEYTHVEAWLRNFSLNSPRVSLHRSSNQTLRELKVVGFSFIVVFFSWYSTLWLWFWRRECHSRSVSSSPCQICIIVIFPCHPLVPWNSHQLLSSQISVCTSVSRSAPYWKDITTGLWMKYRMRERWGALYLMQIIVSPNSQNTSFLNSMMSFILSSPCISAINVFSLADKKPSTSNGSSATRVTHMLSIVQPTDHSSCKRLDVTNHFLACITAEILKLIIGGTRRFVKFFWSFVARGGEVSHSKFAQHRLSPVTLHQAAQKFTMSMLTLSFLIHKCVAEQCLSIVAKPLQEIWILRESKYFPTRLPCTEKTCIGREQPQWFPYALQLRDLSTFAKYLKKCHVSLRTWPQSHQWQLFTLRVQAHPSVCNDRRNDDTWHHSWVLSPWKPLASSSLKPIWAN